MIKSLPRTDILEPKRIIKKMTMQASRFNLIRSALEDALAPSKLEIVDESLNHRGHPGAKSGKGHFRVTIVSKKFDGLPFIQRQRMVYKALTTLMETDIHAISMSTMTPDEEDANQRNLKHRIPSRIGPLQ